MAKGRDAHHAADIVREAIDLGVTLIDTARVYGTEEAVGLGVKGRRDQVVISTKALVGRRDGELVTPAELAGLVDESLKKLATDRIDIFFLHGVTPSQYEHAKAALVPELKRHQEAGKIRFLAISEQFGGDTRHEMLAKALPDDLFDVVMVGFNLLNPSARDRVFPLTQQHDVGTLVMFAVREALSRSDKLREVIAGLIERGEIDKAKIDPNRPLGFLRNAPGSPSNIEAAYRFCRYEPGAHVVLTGTGDPEHLRDNVESILAPPLPSDIRARLKDIFGGVDSISGN
jgi:aryl-alcohol dehydrogenase-like predicted oxidoreductase